MSDDIEIQVVDFIRGLKPAAQAVDSSTDLIGSGLLDSLAIVELVAFLSSQFSAAIGAREITPANLRTPAAVAALVRRTKG